MEELTKLFKNIFFNYFWWLTYCFQNLYCKPALNIVWISDTVVSWSYFRCYHTFSIFRVGNVWQTVCLKLRYVTFFEYFLVQICSTSYFNAAKLPVIQTYSIGSSREIFPSKDFWARSSDQSEKVKPNASHTDTKGNLAPWVLTMDVWIWQLKIMLQLAWSPKVAYCSFNVKSCWPKKKSVIKHNCS